MGHVYVATVTNGIQTFNTGELTITVIVIVYNKKGKFQKCMIIFTLPDIKFNTFCKYQSLDIVGYIETCINITR